MQRGARKESRGRTFKPILLFVAHVLWIEAHCVNGEPVELNRTGQQVDVLIGGTGNNLLGDGDRSCGAPFVVPEEV